MNIPSHKILRCLIVMLYLAAHTIYGASFHPAYASEHGGGEGGEGGEKKEELSDSKKAVIDGDPGNEAYKGPYIELKQINVVAIYRGQPVRHMNCIVVLEMPDQDQWKYVLNKVEVLRSAFVQELHVIGSSQRGALLKDFDFLKSRLLTVATRTVGEGHVQNILIKSSAGRNLPDYYRSQHRDN